MRAYRRKRIDTTHSHPLVRRLYELIAEHQVALEDLAVRSGVALSTIYRWRAHRAPTVHTLEAVCNVLGYRLYITPKGGRPPSGNHRPEPPPSLE